MIEVRQTTVFRDWMAGLRRERKPRVQHKVAKAMGLRLAVVPAE